MPTSALANPRRGGFETRPWPPTLALTRPSRYHSSPWPATIFITSCGFKKTMVIPSAAEESETVVRLYRSTDRGTPHSHPTVDTSAKSLSPIGDPCVPWSIRKYGIWESMVGVRENREFGVGHRKPHSPAIRGLLNGLKRDRKGSWRISISGNWRITFRFEAGDVFNVDLVAYH